MSRGARKVMNWLLLCVGLYAGVLALMFLLQDRMIFVGATWGRGQPVDDPAGVKIERLELPDGAGTFRVAWGEPQSAARGVMLFFLGNGEDLRSGVYWAAQWLDFGLAALVVEYPGYGDSDGEPGVESILAAADVAARAAGERAARLGVPLSVGGGSLGTFSAVHVAARRDVARLVLSAPPTTLAAAAGHRFPWLPIGLLLRHRFDSLANAPAVRCKTIVLHGDRDHVVPQALGRQLAAAIGGPCEFVDAQGHGHMLPLDRNGPFGARIQGFLAD